MREDREPEFVTALTVFLWCVAFWLAVVIAIVAVAS